MTICDGEQTDDYVYVSLEVITQRWISIDCDVYSIHSVYTGPSVCIFFLYESLMNHIN